MYTMCDSTTFALRHTQISLSSILRHFRPPSRHLLLHTHDTNNSEPGIRRGNEDSRGNRGKKFFRGKQINKHAFFSNSPSV